MSSFEFRAGKWYNKDTTITTISTIIVSIILGTVIPSISPGVNLPGQSLFSQIGSQLSTKDLLGVNPIDSLGNVTAPLDTIWKSIDSRLNEFIDSKSVNLPGPLKSTLESRLAVLDRFDNLSVWQVFEIVKSAFILVANILVTVLEISLSILKSVLGLIR